MAHKPLPRPRDPIALAKLIGDIATGQVEDGRDDGKDAVMSELGRAGGVKGGKERAERLTAERRSEIAKAAARVRWSKPE